MRRLLPVLMICLATRWAVASGIVVQKVQGEVSVRQGVVEIWVPLKAGTRLGPEATIRTGTRSSALLTMPGKTVHLPAQVIVDVSDIRNLSQEELMLKLTMQKVRESPYQGKGDQPGIPNAAIVHGTDAPGSSGLAENDAATGELLLNGTRALFDNQFYSTCALKTLDVLRRYPSLKTFETGWLAAEALEKAGLKGEALNAFADLSTRTTEREQQDRVQTRIAALKGSR